jgi:hypothetical protein
MSDSSHDLQTGASCLYAILHKLNEPNLGDRRFFEWLDNASIDYLKGANAELSALLARVRELDAEKPKGCYYVLVANEIVEKLSSEEWSDPVRVRIAGTRGTQLSLVFRSESTTPSPDAKP